MIVILKKSRTQEQIDFLLEKTRGMGLDSRVIEGGRRTTISLLGDTSRISKENIAALGGVETVFQVSKPFKLASIEAKSEPSRIRLPGLEIGGGNFLVMAGPCSVESEEQTIRIAKAVKKAGATVLRGGAFKPRTSPYTFQGLGEEGLKILDQARKETGLPVVSEVMHLCDLESVAKYVDIIQIGSRSMQNFPLLKQLGKIKKPVMLKRGMSATIEEWMMAAEYILGEGNDQVMLCERGISTFDKAYARNTLDLNAVPIIKNISHLPIIVDPSHGTGYRHLVSPMALAGMAAGADSLIIEVHDHPESALSDGPQALLPSDLEQLIGKIKKLGGALGIHVITEMRPAIS